MANVIGVSALNRYVKTLLDKDPVLTDVAVRGEIQNFTHHLRSGDVIVMGTDGAMEGLDPDTARRCLVARRRTEAAQLAVHMRSAGQARRVHADDQTLAVICIGQREKKRVAGI